MNIYCELFFQGSLREALSSTIRVSGWWEGCENARVREKAEGRTKLKNSFRTHQSAARHVGRTSWPYRDYVLDYSPKLSCDPVVLK